ncbi:MAG: hypothetical protein QNJ31_06225 [Candidatus Caenarcaniphilales bacterium]|nr:hypothetical protein [Candidatus Caenarcaniphilales bacterium]
MKPCLKAHFVLGKLICFFVLIVLQSKVLQEKYKLDRNPKLFERLIDKLKDKNSPKTISMTEGNISHKTIYVICT